MSQSTQLANAATELRVAAGKYTDVVSNLAGLIGVTSGTVSVLNQLNAGSYIQSAIQAWQRGARDAYRVTDALNAAATAMTTLAQGIENNLGPIASADAIAQNVDAKPQQMMSAAQQATRALDAITGLASTFVSTLASSAAPSVVGACSTGTEPLGNDEWDGITGEVPGIDLSYLGSLLGDSGGGSGGGSSGGNGNSWWDAMCQVSPQGDEVAAEKNLLQKLQGLLSKQGLSLLFKNADGTINKRTVAHMVGMPLITVGLSAAYNTELMVQEGGFDSVVKKSFEIGILTSLLDGAPYFLLAKKIPFFGGYKLADCTYPLLALQALFGGVVVGGGGQTALQLLNGSPSPSATPTPTPSPTPTP